MINCLKIKDISELNALAFQLPDFLEQKYEKDHSDICFIGYLASPKPR